MCKWMWVDFRKSDSLPPTLHLSNHISFLNLCIGYVCLLQKNRSHYLKDQNSTPDSDFLKVPWLFHFPIKSHFRLPSNIHPISVSHSLPVLCLQAHDRVLCPSLYLPLYLILQVLPDSLFSLPWYLARRQHDVAAKLQNTEMTLGLLSWNSAIYLQGALS